MRKKRKTRPDDWRRRPRKPRHLLRAQQVGPFRVTPTERAAILARAWAAEMTIRDYVVQAALAEPGSEPT